MYWSALDLDLELSTHVLVLPRFGLGTLYTCIGVTKIWTWNSLHMYWSDQDLDLELSTHVLVCPRFGPGTLYACIGLTKIWTWNSLHMYWSVLDLDLELSTHVLVLPRFGPGTLYTCIRFGPGTLYTCIGLTKIWIWNPLHIYWSALDLDLETLHMYWSALDLDLEPSILARVCPKVILGTLSTCIYLPVSDLDSVPMCTSRGERFT